MCSRLTGRGVSRQHCRLEEERLVWERRIDVSRGLNIGPKPFFPGLILLKWYFSPLFSVTRRHVNTRTRTPDALNLPYSPTPTLFYPFIFHFSFFFDLFSLLTLYYFFYCSVFTQLPSVSIPPLGAEGLGCHVWRRVLLLQGNSHILTHRFPGFIF